MITIKFNDVEIECDTIVIKPKENKATIHTSHNPKEIVDSFEEPGEFNLGIYTNGNLFASITGDCDFELRATKNDDKFRIIITGQISLV